MALDVTQRRLSLSSTGGDVLQTWWLLGVIRDELDVEYLVRYAIRPGTPGS